MCCILLQLADSRRPRTEGIHDEFIMVGAKAEWKKSSKTLYIWVGFRKTEHAKTSKIA